MGGPLLSVRRRVALSFIHSVPNAASMAADLGVDQRTVGKWRRRFIAGGVGGLQDEPKSGVPRTITDEQVEAVIVRTLESRPRKATH